MGKGRKRDEKAALLRGEDGLKKFKGLNTALNPLRDASVIKTSPGEGLQRVSAETFNKI